MRLQVYRQKRKFDITPEPRGQPQRGKGNHYVIQKHAARRLHYDLRLELDGVMKSWAITRGPSLVPGEKRLAVHVEDHPIEYNSFEGTIPQGEYGGGTVMIWDRGHWHPEGDPHRGLKKGHLDFTLAGEKLRGRWHLVRMHGRPGESKEAWLLIKSKDEEARETSALDILEEKPLSVTTGRSIEEIAAGKGRKRVWHSNRSAKENTASASRLISSRAQAVKQGRANPAAPRARRATRGPERMRSVVGSKKNAKKANAQEGEPQPRDRLPDFIPPSLATLREVPPTDKGWVHEIKFDGYRIQARVEHGKVRLLTRKGLDWTSKFPNIATTLGNLPVRSALIDGEIVVEDERGASSFSGLQAALKEGARDAFIYYVFDLLHLDGRDFTALPLTERKAQLARLIEPKARGSIRLSEHFEEDGKTMLRHACAMGLEGIVSKRRNAPYSSGRSENFIKTKCANEQEFVVGGYSPSTVQPKAIGALVVGYYDGNRFIYAGRVGTGFTQSMARDLWKRLAPLATDSPAFDEFPRAEARRRDVQWVEPKTVIESHFRGWTADKLVRQAAFKGVREDKSPQEVMREVPVMNHKNASTRQAAAKRTARASPPDRTAARRQAAPPKAAAGRQPSNDSEVRFTNPDRVYWVDVGITKQDLGEYYRSIWEWMAPHLVDRPLSLVRCPEGTKGECFFQKHASAGLTEKNLKTVIDKNKRQIIAVEDIDGLLSLVQAGVLEVHVRGSMINSLEICDLIVFDIDPGEGVSWSEVIAAARDVRQRLSAIGLQSFVKLSGGKGLHVVLPIDGADWDTTKSFAQAVAVAMNADRPDRYVAKITKSLRRGKIFVDYFRNSLEQTSIAAYSTRARTGAPVSAPVTWEELSRTKAGNQYTVLNLGKRLKNLKHDPWQDMGRIRQKLPDLRELRRR
jgi:bifunctional non-homologous end joining protein LigD